jgi:hypothetical protein
MAAEQPAQTGATAEGGLTGRRTPEVQFGENGLASRRASGILGWFALMRWLMIGLMISLGALLLAAAGVARHIRLHRANLNPASSAHETDLEP